MRLILQGVTIIDPASPYHQLKKDIRITDGSIDAIEDRIKPDKEAQVHTFDGLFISPGWFDLFASFCDPGLEQKEDINSGIEAAAAGGFTSVALLPNTSPALHSKSEIEYVRNKAAGKIVTLYPYGAVTKKREGKDLTEMYDMRNAGAIAFTDADFAISDPGIMLRSLLYVKTFDGVVMNIPNDHAIVGHASLNEGTMSTQLGMYGIPDVLEELMVIRDIHLAEYTGSRVHVGVISSAKSIPHIREAKKRGVRVTASVSAYHLYFDESELYDYNTNFKVNPPLRKSEDIQALIEALKDGTIDAICSFHLPHESDVKDVEFENAADGMECIETVFGAAHHVLNGHLSIENLIDKIAIAPRKILGVKIPSVQEGGSAEFTIFDPGQKYIFTNGHIRSKSTNNGFTGKEMTGKAVAIIHRNQIKIL